MPSRAFDDIIAPHLDANLDAPGGMVTADDGPPVVGDGDGDVGAEE